MLNYIEKQLAYEEYSSFIQRSGSVADVDQKRFNWLYYQNPFGVASFYCAYDDKSLVGTEIHVPLMLKHKKGKVLSALAVGSIVDPAYRGKGIWSKLIELSIAESKKKGIKVIWGQPNAKSQPILLNKLDWKITGKVCYLSSLLGPNPKRNFLIRAAQNVLAFAVKQNTKNVLKTLKLGEMNYDLPGTVGNEQIMIYKDVNYITWRYRDIPEQGYRVKTITKDDKLLCLLVFKTSNQTMYLFDYLVYDKQIVRQLLKIIQRIGLNEGCRKVVLSTNTVSDYAKHALSFIYLRRTAYVNMAFVVDPAFKNILSEHWVHNIGDEDIKFTKELI